MALTTQELNTVNWSWTALGNEWSFDPRRTSLPHPDEKVARDSLSTSEIDAIVGIIIIPTAMPAEIALKTPDPGIKR